MSSKVNTDIVAALGMCDVSSCNPRRTDEAAWRGEGERGLARGSCERASGCAQCGHTEFTDSCWKELSCGLALERPAEWLQLRCSVRERKKPKQNT